MKLIIIPFRLAVDPSSPSGQLYLERAFQSVMNQTWSGQFEILLCVDPGKGSEVPAGFSRFMVIEAESASQVSALNAGLRMAGGDTIAFLEDDVWLPRRLETGLPLLNKFDVVTSNKLEFELNGGAVRINDFPTPSGWLMHGYVFNDRRFDESFRYHMDTDFLGYIKQAGFRRVHQVESGVIANLDTIVKHRPWLKKVNCNSSLSETTLPVPLIKRLINPAGGIGTIVRDGEARVISRMEHQEMRRRYHEVPW